MIHGDVLGERARLTPAKLALVDVATGTRLTYAELDARATRCARMLRERAGFARGDRIGLLAGNRLEYLDLFFAAAKAGVILVTLGTRLTPHELEHIIADSGMRALVYDGAFVEAVRALAPAATIQRWIALDDPAAPSHERYSALLDVTPAGSWARERCAPEDVYALLYTSGTTGRPKGVMIPHRMVAWNGYNTVVSWQLREDDVSPIFTPLYHAGALGAFLLPVLTIGGTIVLHKGFDTTEVWRTIVEEKCTVVLGVPTIWKLLMDAPEFATADLSPRAVLRSGGAPLPEYIAEAYQARGVRVQAGLRAHRGRRELLRHDRRGIGSQARLDWEAVHDDRGSAHRRAGARRARGRGGRALAARAAREPRVLEQPGGDRGRPRRRRLLPHRRPGAS